MRPAKVPLSCAFAALLAVSANADSGTSALERKDFEKAAILLHQEALAGSANAKLQLGLMYDLGLGTARNAAKALGWYREAAADGSVDAQFNVGVMLDSGAGIERDPSIAAAWYSRAAANGHSRAQYNLGLLYEIGEGVPENPDLATYWLSLAAAELPAAAQRVGTIDTSGIDTRVLRAPDILAAALVSDGAQARAELVWSTPPTQGGSRFHLELLAVDDSSDEIVTTISSESTEASALSIPVPDKTGPFVWRISGIDSEGLRYAASDWQQLSSQPSMTVGPGPIYPRARVSLHVEPGDAGALRLAEEISAGFRGAGLWVETRIRPEGPGETTVAYGFAEDAAVAERVAEFLPVLNKEDAVRNTDTDIAPGEVVAWLYGGPAETEFTRPDDWTSLDP